jgi:hypothetical protein
MNVGAWVEILSPNPNQTATPSHLIGTYGRVARWMPGRPEFEFSVLVEGEGDRTRWYRREDLRQLDIEGLPDSRDAESVIAWLLLDDPTA